MGGIGNAAHRRVIGRDEYRPALFSRRRPRQIRQHQRLAATRKTRQRKRRGGGKDAVDIGHDQAGALRRGLWWGEGREGVEFKGKV